MDLQYIWVERYLNIYKQGFCFSGTHSISFNEEKNEVSIEQYEHPIPRNFWGKNITSITAIIGKNGAGKTNLLELILEIFSLKKSKSYYLGTKLVAVFWNKESGFKIVNIDPDGKTNVLKGILSSEKEVIESILVSKSDLDLSPLIVCPLRS